MASDLQKVRENLQTILEGILGSSNVYYQPPSSIKIEYPCILYHLSNTSNMYSNNKSYLNVYRFDLTVVDTDPESEIIDKLQKLDYCRFDRTYTADGLNHWVYVLYYSIKET